MGLKGGISRAGVGDYSPFDKPIGELTPLDLSLLKAVTEGWYVEYKVECPSASALAKAISSFANTHGGWLFLGIEEKSKEDPTAGAFPGICDRDLQTTLQRIRQSAAQSLDPTPHFETGVLRGPCAEIGLVEGNFIVAVEVPRSNSAPHVHRDGRVYRRVGDSSEPRPETDRHLLEQLWQRSKEARRRVRKWTRRDPELSKGEEDVPYLRLMMCIDPWLQLSYPLAEHLSEVRDVLSGLENGVPSLSFDSVNAVPGGVLGRQVMGNDPRHFGLTARLWADLRFDITIPIPVYRNVEFDQLGELLEGYVHGSQYVELLKSAGHQRPDVADLNMLLLSLIGTISKFRRVLRLFGGPEGCVLHVKARTLNFWRVLSFVDVAEIFDDFKRFGVPVAIEEVATWPSADDPMAFFAMEEPEIDTTDGADRESVMCCGQAWQLFALIAPMFGCTCLEFDRDAADKAVPVLRSFDDLYEAGARAREVQRRRLTGSL